MELNWLLCNKCFVHLKEAKSPFSMTQCGHLFCRKCIAKVGDHCPICNANGVESICLTTPLQPMIVPMFEDIHSVAEKLVLAAKFQKYQLSILTHREQELAKKYLALKTAYWQVTKQIEKVNQEYNAVKRDCADLIAQNNARDHEFYKDSARNARVTFSRQNAIFGKNQPEPHHMFRPGSGNDSEDSDVSGSTIRGLHPPSGPEGIFRVPIVPRVPRSIASTASSRLSTPMSLDYDQSGRGYGSDTSAYFRR
ncbi:zip homologous protein 2-like [Diachasmimorpha longicaudata]|uniref:zip homologous protein 2-like n=1 Tax=Diachasmimorpha longicaudata TaxID=58733 RepID=UPI0030B90D0B